MAWTYENGSPGSVSGIIAWKGAWATATDYIVGDGVSNDGSSYVCKLAHTSAAATEPGTGASWTTYWDLIAQKGDAGASGGANIETPVGAINGVNKTFTVSNTPKWLTVDGQSLYENNGYTLAGLTITMDNAPVYVLRSHY